MDLDDSESETHEDDMSTTDMSDRGSVGSDRENDVEMKNESENVEDEADSHELVETSVIDLDDLHPIERLQMCHRAVRLLTYAKAELRRGEAIGPSRYYAMVTKQEYSDEETLEEPVYDVKSAIVRAIRCPATPGDIYVTVNEVHDVDLGYRAVMWAIMNRTGESPPFDIYLYKLRLYTEIHPGMMNPSSSIRECPKFMR